jgi:hypothetical protein
LVVVVLAAPAFAEESYTLKFKIDPDAGKTVQHHSYDTSTGSSKFFDTEGKLLLEQKKEGNESTYRVTILGRDKDGKATKKVRVYEKATEKEDGKSKTFSYQGRTLVIEKVDGKDRIGVVGEPPLDPKDVEKLYKDLDKKSETKAILDNLSPGKPVKVGDSWPVPVKPISEALDDMPVDLAKSSVAAKLVKVYSKGKSQYGTFELTMKFVLSGKSEKDGVSFDFQKPAEFMVNETMDVAIDGSTVERTEAGNVTMKGEAFMTTGGQKLRVVFDVQSKGGEEVSAEAVAPKGPELGKVAFLPRPGEWREFAAKDFGFKAKFPGSPTKKANTNANGITTTEFSLQTDGGLVYYSVNVTDYPPDKFKIDAASAYENLKKAENVTDAKDIKIAGHPAIELKQDLKKDVLLHISQRVVIVGQRMYQMVIVAADGSKPDAKQFFESFQMDEKAIKKDD